MSSHPIQYQTPWFRALAQVVDLEVYFCHRQDGRGQAEAGFRDPFEWDVPLLEGYRHHWLENRAAEPNVFAFSGCDTPGIDGVIATGGFDACIVSGWYLKSYLQAIRACRKHHVAVLLRGDSHLGTRRSRVKSALKWLPYRVFLDRVDGHLYVGQRNKAYLKHYGVGEEKLFFVPHFVDNHFFASRSERARADGTCASLRSQLGIPDAATVGLFVGKRVREKRVEDLLAAVSRAGARSRAPFHTVVVGSGPADAELRAFADSCGARVHFVGFHNQTELPRVYAMADVLVLPSAETWGLVVNEAMACGVPAIVSDAAGCAPDLIDETVTGCLFPIGDVDALADKLVRLQAEMTMRAEEIRQAVRTRAALYSCEAAVEGTLKAMEAVCKMRRQRESRMGR